MNDIHFKNLTNEQRNELRKIMGTEMKSSKQLDTQFFEGVKSITAKLLDASKNPYKSIYDMCTSTWTTQHTKIDKWPETSIEGRMLVVRAALEGKTLPAPLEAPSFTFAVENLSRSAYDQIARARFFGIASQGTRDNEHSDIGIRIPNSLLKTENKLLLEKFKETALKCKQTYNEIVNSGQSNWQTARAILPQSIIHKFSFTCNYQALKGFMSQRLKVCEQEDTVASAIMIWKEVFDTFPLLAVYMRPGCDFKQKCDYHEAYFLSEAFSCLFAGCGRWEDPYPYSQFNESCTTYEILEEQLGFHFPKPTEWNEYVEKAWQDKKTIKLFEEE